MRVSLIAAASRDRVIGHNNSLPWHLPEDLQYFKKVTFGKPIIMGRKTYESIGRALPGRYNIVVTRDPKLALPSGLNVAHDIREALMLAETHLASLNETSADEVFVIGGGQLYQEMLDCATRIYLTLVDISVEGDAYFPQLDDRLWELTEIHECAGSASIPHKYCIYERRMVN